MKDGQRNRVNRLGATAFFLAAKNTDIEVMTGARRLPARTRRMPSADGTTPLMVAAGLAMWNLGEDGGSLPGQEDEVLEAVKLCVELGNDVNAANDIGETPMHGAAFRGVNAIVEYLLEQGAQPRRARHARMDAAHHRQRAQLQRLLQAAAADRGAAEDARSCARLVRRGPDRRRDRVPRLHPDAPDQASAALDRDERMEADFAKSEAKRLRDLAGSSSR